MRWQPERFALRVWLQAHPTLVNVSEALLWQTLLVWQTASHSRVGFVQAASAEQADIELLWASQTTLGRDYEVGHTRHRLVHAMPDGGPQLQAAAQGFQNIDHVTIELMTEPLIDRQLDPMACRQRVIATVLHEMGHALGLEHSPNPQDVMYYRGWQNTQLTAGDLRQLASRYVGS